MGKLDELVFKLSADISKFEQGLNKASAQMSEFGAGAEKKMSKVAVAVGAAAAATVAGVGKAIFEIGKVGSGYEASMSQVAATMGIAADKGDASFAMLSAAAEEAGRTTMFSASQAADALNYLALAGYDAEKSVETLPKVLDLAAAGGLDLAYATDLVTDNMSALGLEMDYLDTFIDQMAVTSQKSNTSVGQLGEAIKTVGGTAKDMAGGTTELNQVLAILADNGIKGSEAGTKLRNILLDMTPTTADAAAAFEQIGLSTYDAEGNLRSMEDVFADINKGLENMTSEEKTGWINKVFNKADLAAVNALLGTSDERWQELTMSIEDADGAASQMAKTMADNLQGDLNEFKSALEGVAIQIYASLVEPFRSAAEAGTEALRELSEELAKPKMKAALDTIASGFSSLIEMILNIVTAVIPKLVSGAAVVIDILNVCLTVLSPLIEGLSFMVENLDLVAAALIPLTVGIGLYVVAIKGLNIDLAMTAKASGGMIAAFKAKIAIVKKSTLAVLANTAAFLASPIGWITVGVAALAAGIVYLVKRMNEQTEESKRLNDENQKLLDGTNALVDSVKKTGTAFDEKISSMEAEVAVSRNLLATIDEMSAKEEKTEGDKRRLAATVELLNESMGETVLVYDAENDALSETVANIEELISKREEQARAAAAQERAIEIAKEQIGVEQQLHDVRMQMVAWHEALQEGTITQKEYQQAIEDLGGQQVDLIHTQNKLADSMEFVTNIVVDSMEEITEASDKMASAAEVNARKGVAAFEFMSEAQQKAIAELAKEYKTLEAAATNMFAAMSDESDISVTDMTGNLLENQRVVGEWANNIEELAKRGIDDGLLETLRGAGPEAAGHVKALVEASDDELVALNVAFRSGGETAINALAAAFGVDYSVANEARLLAERTDESLTKALEEANFYKKGEYVAEGLANGIRAKTEEAVRAARQLAAEVEQAAKTQFQERSPSRVFARIGENVVKGFAVGVEKLSYLASDAVDGVFGSLGENVIKDFSKGVEKFSSLANDTVDNVFGKLGGAAEKRLPSFSRLGENVVKGFAKGVEKMSGLANDAISDVFGSLNDVDVKIDLSVDAAIGNISQKVKTPFMKGLKDVKNIQDTPDVAQKETAKNCPSCKHSESEKTLSNINNFNFYGLTVRDDRDIDTIAAKVEQALTKKFRNTSVAKGVRA
jgi:TP901 family phage tail tape measure protein